MTLSMRGESTSGNTEVECIVRTGVWLSIPGKGSKFLSYEAYPWFKGAGTDKIFNVKEPRAGHYHWPDLDVDISIKALENPERYPLKSKVGR